MSRPSPKWYLSRLRHMSVAELAGRSVDATRRRAWARRQVRADSGGTGPALPGPARGLPSGPRSPGGRRFEPGELSAVLAGAPAGGVIEAADQIMSGRWEILGVLRKDMEDPDWFMDPVTGRSAPRDALCFRINHRSEADTGNVKQVWELSRHHHVTVLAAAYALTGEDRYARRAGDHLRSWWDSSPFLSGVHWTSGIEIGIRLISWTWTRRLLDRWPEVRSLFEDNPSAVRQIRWHQQYLATFRSRGSSANNHLVAEAAGQLVASLAFPWFDESPRWASRAAVVLERAVRANTFPSGVNREMAFEYHGLVAELLLVAGAEADRAGRPLGTATWARLGAMLDVVAATVDESMEAPRYGDGDDGRALCLSFPGENRWTTLLCAGEAVVGRLPWWPAVRPDLTGSLLAALTRPRTIAGRPSARPSSYPDAGLTVLRAGEGPQPEIWCRCDDGPMGFLSLAAHGHADALSVEVRHGGVEILADPGTYCYHGEPVWRQYFRSTLGHNTVEVGRRDQAHPDGPFMWSRHARGRRVALEEDRRHGVATWSAEHDGYATLDPPAAHRRTVTLDACRRRIEIADVVRSGGPHPVRVAFHVGPEVRARLEGHVVDLAWERGATPRTARLRLDPRCTWSAHVGELDPVLGWYSRRFGHKQPSATLVGVATVEGALELRTALEFHD